MLAPRDAGWKLPSAPWLRPLNQWPRITAVGREAGNALEVHGDSADHHEADPTVREGGEDVVIEEPGHSGSIARRRLACSPLRPWWGAGARYSPIGLPSGPTTDILPGFGRTGPIRWTTSFPFPSISPS
jgi:hypothetical protein